MTGVGIVSGLIEIEREGSRQMQTLGLYIHIPFCVAKCKYCGFTSFADVDETKHREYVDKLIEEIKKYGNQYRNSYKVDTVFIGGGTPSILEPYLIEKIMVAIYENFELDIDTEITMEANPKTLTREKLLTYKKVGVNRLSIGVQSFDDIMLKNLGRIHTADDFRENFALARECGFDNINIDLMFAIPNHTLEIWENTLEQAIDIGPEHISFYSLQIEEGTPFFEMFKNGEIDQIPDDVDRQMYHLAIKKLKEAGYQHYEISNCAKAGYQCRHNLKYWSMEDYLGIGLDAHSYIQGSRFFTGFDADELLQKERHINSPEDNMSEYVFTGLRKTQGISLTEFQQRYGQNFWQAFGDRKTELQPFFDRGYIIEEDNKLRLSEEGIDISNKIMAVFV